MKLKELLTLLKSTQQRVGTSEAYICGGASRDRYMNNLANIEDIDITTGDNTVHYLADEFYLSLKKDFNISKRVLNDGHISLQVGNLKVDFSSNYNSKYVLDTMTPLERETWSRDFTCNALLTNLDLTKIIDITKRAKTDIDSKILNTCLSPEKSLIDKEYKRLPRIIYMAAKLNFTISKDIVDFVHQNKKLFGEINKDYFERKINKSLLINPTKTVNAINTLGIWDYIPINKTTLKYFNERNNAAPKVKI